MTLSIKNKKSYGYLKAGTIKMETKYRPNLNVYYLVM